MPLSPDPLPTWRSNSVEALRPFASVRLVVADLDGTLVADPADEPWPSISELERGLRLGRPLVRLSVATGRPMRGVVRIVEAIGLPPQTPIVLYNGALVVRANRSSFLARHTIGAIAAAEFANEVGLLGGTVLVYFAVEPWEMTGFHIPSYDGLDEVVIGVAPNESEMPRFDGYGIPILWVSYETLIGILVTTQPVAILVPVRSLPPAAIPNLGNDRQGLSLTSSGSTFLEVRPEGVNKAVGTAVLAKSLGVTQDQVLAIGDADNDFELLQWARLSVSVQGAAALAASASQYQSAGGPARAVVETLNLIRLARRLFPAQEPV